VDRGAAAAAIAVGRGGPGYFLTSRTAQANAAKTLPERVKLPPAPKAPAAMPLDGAGALGAGGSLTRYNDDLIPSKYKDYQTR